VEPPELLSAEPQLRPYLQEEAAASINPEVLALCPKAERARSHNTLEIEEENRVLRVEAGEQGKIPFLIIRPKWHHSKKRRPVVICMHGTGHNKESMRPFMEAYAALGFVAVAVDARYHGGRGRSQHAYMDVSFLSMNFCL
jgi:acetyl esterase/lipase